MCYWRRYYKLPLFVAPALGCRLEPAALLLPDLFTAGLTLLRRFMVDSLTLSGRGVPLESSGLRFSSGRSMNIRLFLKIYR